ncbi:Amiloride-sensitive sodium channel [Popillia japonica]|uniref:Amiloride-sensitive sodium channel n=1 Tax=Popillia japonica TaxID=7064 RepID=A0AAW1JXU9_POPJA
MKFSKTTQNVCKYFEECTDKSATDGVQYFGDTKRTACERILWLLIWIISVIVCTIFLVQTYEKWDRSPVFVTIGAGQMPIQDISFPAVTICPKTKYNRDLFTHSDVMYKSYADQVNLTESEKLELEYMMMVCKRDSKNNSRYHKYYDTNMLHFLNKVKPNVNETFRKCRFAGVEKSCDKVFTPIFTKTGVCYTFNILDHEELFTEDVPRFEDFYTTRKSVCFNQPYSKKCKNVYPKRATSSGNAAGFSVELVASAKDLDFKCVNPIQGYKIILHDPADIPTWSHDYFLLPLNMALMASVTPEVITTELDLKSYPPNKRQCYFDEEKVLTKLKHYSQSNCEAECLIQLMEHDTQCTDFYFPRTNLSDKICGMGSLEAVEFFEKRLINTILDPDDVEFFNRIDLENAKEHCNCLPSCSSVDYSTETTQSHYFWEGMTNSDNNSYRSVLAVFFKEGQYIPLQRKEMFGAMDFIAYSGGLLGLFIGGSFMSLVELVYFLTLRIVCNIKMFGKEFWHGNKD